MDSGPLQGSIVTAPWCVRRRQPRGPMRCCVPPGRTLPTGAPRRHWHNPRGRGQLDLVELRTYIVEDNATIRENLVGTLEELASVRSLGWSDGEQAAREWLAGHRDWDLLIVDLFLRQGSGLGVLESAQARGRTQRVIVLSNYATADMRKRCSELGADAVFDKSNEIDALVDYCLALAASP